MAIRSDRHSMAAGKCAASTLTRPLLRLLYSNFSDPEFDIADCRLATKCQGQRWSRLRRSRMNRAISVGSRQWTPTIGHKIESQSQSRAHGPPLAVDARLGIGH
jgi:hypothetical protein